MTAAIGTIGVPEGARQPSSVLPVATIVSVLLVIWYLAAIPMNAGLPDTVRKLEAAGADPLARLLVSWSLDRPVLPAPHQVLFEFWKTVFLVAPTSNRSLIYHIGITLGPTLLGFALGIALGVGLAIAIIGNRTLSKSLMPWIVASQTIPILAIAPMVIVVLGSLGMTGLLPKSLISMYLCFFPITIGMVKGLTSCELTHLDLLRTYNASSSQVLVYLRWPAALPYLFAALKVAISIALIGAIVGELPTGAQAGIGARLLSGSYYGQTLQIWSALLAASLLAASLVWSIGATERLTNRALGQRT
jgi:NitT/TauT family transport system permease protein